MSTRNAKLMFVLLIVLVTLLFFIHVPNGGFQSKNGPTTPINKLQLLAVSLLFLLAFWQLSGIFPAAASLNLARRSAGLAPASLAFTVSTSLRC